MAAYRADIEIGVVGAARLKELQDRITRLSRAIDDVNVKAFIDNKAVQSLAEYSGAAGKAAANLRETAIQLDAAGKASGNYASAISQLVTAVGQENSALKIQNDLIKEEIELRRKAKLAASGIRETTQYAGPIGPGPASPVGSLVGQKSPVEERIKRTIEGRKDEVALQEALLRLEEKSAAAANKELQARGEIARLTAQGVNAATFRAAQPNAPLALPAFQERGLQLLDDSLKLNESNLRIETALNGQRQRGVRFLEKQTAEEERQVRLGILGNRTNQLPGQGRATGTVPAGGFPVSGPLQSPGFQSTQRQVGRFGENLALGAGFPLLFGGGAGAVGGSILGSFVGSGFGGQILGGALGQVLDQAVQSAAKLGTALQTLDLRALEESGLRVNANLETQVQLLRQAGDVAGAQQLIQEQILRSTGALPGTVEGISDAVNLLNSSWGEFTAAASVALGIVSAPFAAALSVIIDAVTLIVKGFNFVASGIGTAIRAVGEWVVRLVAGEEALKRINDQLKENNREIEKARVEYAPILANLNGQVLLNKELFDLEKQKSVATNAAAKERNAQLTLEQNLIKTNADFDDQIRQAREKINSANQQSIEQQVRLLELRRSQTIESQKLESSLEIQAIREAERIRLQREAERAAKEAARAAEEARRKELQQLQNVLSLRGQLIQATLEAANIDVEKARFTQGEAAAITEELNQLQARLDLQARGLQLQLEQNLLAEDLTAQQKSLLEGVYQEQVRNLTAQVNLRQQILKAAAAELKFQKFTGTQSAVREATQPFKDLTQQRQQEIQFNKTFLRLVTEGIIPAEAERIANFERLGTERLRAIDQDIEYTKVLLNQAEAYGVNVTRIDELRQSLEKLQAARGATADIFAAGAGQGPSDRERLDTEIARLQGNLNQLTDPINRITVAAEGIGNAVANSVVRSIDALIEGTATAKQIFSDFLKSVGDILIQEGAKLIATYIAIGIARAFAGLASSSSTTSSTGPNPGGIPSTGNVTAPSVNGVDLGATANFAAKGAYWPGGFKAFANGGFVTRPTIGVVGEGTEAEYIIPASKMPSAMTRYAAGIRGGGVIDGAVSDNRNFLDSLTTGINGSTVATSEQPADAAAATRASLRETERFRETQMQVMNQQTERERRFERERMEQMASTPGNLNIRYESQVINNVEYVTREQAERLAAQSALRGRELAINSLQTSVKTRKRVGMA